MSQSRLQAALNNGLLDPDVETQLRSREVQQHHIRTLLYSFKGRPGHPARCQSRLCRSRAPGWSMAAQLRSPGEPEVTCQSLLAGTPEPARQAERSRVEHPVRTRTGLESGAAGAVAAFTETSCDVIQIGADLIGRPRDDRVFLDKKGRGATVERHVEQAWDFVIDCVERAAALRPVRHHAGDARLDRAEPAGQRRTEPDGDLPRSDDDGRLPERPDDHHAVRALRLRRAVRRRGRGDRVGRRRRQGHAAQAACCSRRSAPRSSSAPTGTRPR